jgi:hypothetical protein
MFLPTPLPTLYVIEIMLQCWKCETLKHFLGHASSTAAHCNHHISYTVTSQLKFLCQLLRSKMNPLIRIVPVTTVCYQQVLCVHLCNVSHKISHTVKMLNMGAIARWLKNSIGSISLCSVSQTQEASTMQAALTDWLSYGDNRTRVVIPSLWAPWESQQIEYGSGQPCLLAWLSK